MTRRLAALVATALAVHLGSAAAAELPREAGQACHASTLALEKREPDAEPARLADDPACRAFAAAFTALTREPAPVSSEGVRDALALYGTAPRRGAAMPVDRVRLEAMLAEIRTANDKPPETAWQRFVRWLRETLNQEQRRDRGTPGWLRWLDGLSPELLRAVWWSLFTLMAGSLAWVVFRELRAADAF
ncbi:MAG TPA: hypothetical protein VJM11_15855, partial [Nevskiaceae bacterium]|nr:hypothetical protein [Nevskiaceae bacterium]